MSALKERIDTVRTFFGDVMTEMKKASWPTRQELMSSTVMVIVSAFLLSAFVGISDKFLVTVLRLLIPAG